MAWLQGGTPWQRRLSVRSWLVTMVMAGARPRRTAMVIAGASRPRTANWNLGIWCVCVLAGHLIVDDHYLAGLPVLFVVTLALASAIGLRTLRVASGVSGPAERHLRRQVVGHALFPLIFGTVVFHVVCGSGVVLVNLLYELLASRPSSSPSAVRVSEVVALVVLIVAVLAPAWGVVASVRMCRIGAERLGRMARAPGLVAGV
ncbi:MAG: hypothetical protein ACTS3F_14765 [Phycisphaerales bacterium]